MKTYKVDYHFFKSYIKQDLEKSFEKRFEKRIILLKNTLKELNWEINESNTNIDYLLQEHFVEIFSWSVIPYRALQDIYEHVKPFITDLIDPCCGNAFHTYLFQQFTPLSCVTIDIQDEPESWTPIQVENGKQALKNSKQQDSTGLLLSWIDYEQLCLDLLDLYKGPVVISIGNYHNISNNYLKRLHQHYKLSYEITLMMPWGMKEQIEIYAR